MDYETANYKEAVSRCSKLLAERNLTIAFAESATAGKLAYEFSLTTYSGAILTGGIVCYNACVKEDMLGIAKETIAKYTPESAEVTKEMCRSLQRKMPAEVRVAVTGLTAPGGSESPQKPVGTMFYCIMYKQIVHEQRVLLEGNPSEIVNQSIAAISLAIWSMLTSKR
ncbi:CinA family protein [Sphingobacterium sp. LRF_L2]|uniref:CinA family protein n=1 Tax=Sphingobacterium sp. LRF_L2 TaxID=3369421 RepID=UPI003F5D7D89